jgi:predicted deacetylase
MQPSVAVDRADSAESANATDTAARRALCVAIHDVAPRTWPACIKLLDAIRAVADIPLTFLVVPRFHGDARHDPAYEAALASLAAGGHELALHGYTHLDEGPPPRGVQARLLRSVYTTREGEFAALDANEARRRIELGLDWFARRGWRPAGFVPPAWLLGEGAWEALRGYPFSYTTTYRHLHLLPGSGRLASPALVYAARNRAGRFLSPPAASWLAFALRRAPLVRIALHPRDALHPALLRHAQQLIARLLVGREALTKAAVAALAASDAAAPGRAASLDSLTSTDPSIRPSPSDAVRSPYHRTDHSAGRRPWR